VLVATGGFPKKEQFAWLEALGHSILPPAPSLFTFNLPKHPITELMGLSVDEAVVRINGTKWAERGPLLITHWGLSGPVVLRSSAWAARDLQERGYSFDIRISWLPDENQEGLKEQFQQLRRQNGKGVVWHKNPFGLPRRLWEYLLLRCGIAELLRWGELPASGQQKLTEALLQDAYHVSGKTTFKEEFVTCGGIRVSEVDPRRLESRLVPGLFFAGEVLDVDGITGGYNFQHAWCSGWLAARAMDAY
jgi:predicted Rossmann fold flavoprotein